MLDLLSLKQSIKELGGAKDQGGISVHTLRSWIYQKRIPHVKLGRRVFLRREDLENFVNRNIVEAKE